MTDADPTVPPVSTGAWRNAVFVAFAASGFAFANWVARVPAVRDALSLSTQQMGLIILGLSGGSVAGLMLANSITLRIGPSRTIGASLVLSGFALAFVGASATLWPHPAPVFVGLMVLGFGYGACDVAMNVQGALVEQRVGRTLMPLLHATFSLGTLAGAGLGSVASALAVPVLGHLAAVGVVIAAAILLVARKLPSALPVHEDPERSDNAVEGAPGAAGRVRTALAVWADRRLLLIGVVMLGMSFAEGTGNDWISLASVDGHGLSNTGGALTYAVFVAAMTVGRLVGGPVLDRFGRVPVVRVTAGLAVAGLALFIFAPWAGLAVAGTALWGLGASLGFPVGMSAAADDPAKAGARVGAVATMGYAAFLVGPPLLGVLGQRFGILHALLLAGVLVVAAFLASPSVRRERPGTGTPG